MTKRKNVLENVVNVRIGGNYQRLNNPPHLQHHISTILVQLHKWEVGQFLVVVALPRNPMETTNYHFLTVPTANLKTKTKRKTPISVAPVAAVPAAPPAADATPAAVAAVPADAAVDDSIDIKMNDNSTAGNDSTDNLTASPAVGAVDYDGDGGWDEKSPIDSPRMSTTTNAGIRDKFGGLGAMSMLKQSEFKIDVNCERLQALQHEVMTNSKSKKNPHLKHIPLNVSQNLQSKPISIETHQLYQIKNGKFEVDSDNSDDDSARAIFSQSPTFPPAIISPNNEGTLFVCGFRLICPLIHLFSKK